MGRHALNIRLIEWQITVFYVKIKGLSWAVIRRNFPGEGGESAKKSIMRMSS